MQSLPLRAGLGPGLSLGLVRDRTWARVRVPATAALLAAATVVSRVPFAGRYLFNWDAVQFAMGVQRFDLAAHRPHPPGYLGYIVIARVMVALTGGGTDAVLVALSIAAEAATVLGAYLVARRFLGEFAGIATATLLLTSPLFWLYGETALTYGLEPGMALLGFVLVARAVRRGEGLGLAGAAVGLAGAIRPSTEFFLLPLLGVGVLLATGSRGRRAIVAPALGLLGATSLWLVPLVAISHGPIAYLQQGSLLAGRVSGGSAFWSAGLGGLMLDSNAVLMGVGYSVGLFLPLALAAAAFALVPGLDLDRPRSSGAVAVLLMAWVLPALSVFVLVHIGQLAYVLFVLPALALAGGPVLERVATILAGHRPRSRLPLRASLLGACAAVNCALFLLPQDSFAQQVRDRDRHVEALLGQVRAHAPESTLLMADPEGPGSYRLASYYLPGYVTTALGRDRSGTAGELFASDGGAPEYDLHRFDRAGPLRLPDRAQALILDPAVFDLIGDAGRLRPISLNEARNDRIYIADLDRSDPPVAWRSAVYLRGSDCPCFQMPPTTRSVAPLAPL